MDSIDVRLARCFGAVFPAIAHADIPDAAPTTVSGWDSVATVTLIATIEEEFGIELDLEAIGGALSFQRFYEYLQSQETLS